MSGAAQQHRFTINPTFAEVSDLVTTAAELCARVMAGPLADSLRLCLAEALNNVVEHAYRDAADGRIDVTLKLAPDGFDATVTDTGVAMPGGAPPMGEVDWDITDLGTLPEGGFGWMLIRSEVDRLDYRRCGPLNILTMGKTADA